MMNPTRNALIPLGIIFIIAAFLCYNTNNSSYDSNTNEHRQLNSSPSSLRFDPKTIIRKQQTIERTYDFGQSSDNNKYDYVVNGGVVVVPNIPDPFPTEAIFTKIVAPKLDTTHYFETCVPTSQYQVSMDPKTHEVVLQSLDIHGQLKTTGGDEVYVTYHDNANDPSSSTSSPNAVARVQDLQNGKYALDFWMSRSPRLSREQRQPELLSGTGTITIHLIYTCHAGDIEPPLKMNWPNSGAVFQPASSNDSANQPFAILKNYPQPLLHHPPSLVPFRVDLSTYDVVLTIGDSIHEQLVGCIKKIEPGLARTDSCQRRPNVPMADRKAGTNLNTKSATGRFMDMAHGVMSSEKNTYGRTPSTHKMAMIVGSCVWDLVTWKLPENVDMNAPYDSRGFFSYQDNLIAAELLVTQLQTEYPNMDIIWKGCTVIHKHMSNCYRQERKNWIDDCHNRLKYPSFARAQKLNELQKDLMINKLHIPFMDMYDLSYDMAEFHLPGDALHYNREFNDFLMDVFYKPQEQQQGGSDQVRVQEVSRAS